MKFNRRRFSRCCAAAVMCGAMSLGVAAPASETPQKNPAPQVKFTTNVGDFVIEVYPDKAPKTAANFLQYVRDKFYDGTIFHRVIGDFMVQGGGFDDQYRQKKTRDPVPHEGLQALRAGLHNDVGSVAMARTGDPNSATAQFFINVVDNSRLDPVEIPEGDPIKNFEYQGRTYNDIPRAKLEGNPLLAGYTVFGRVISGMDTVEKIRRTPTGSGGPFPTDVPKNMIMIQTARVVKK